MKNEQSKARSGAAGRSGAQSGARSKSGSGSSQNQQHGSARRKLSGKYGKRNLAKEKPASKPLPYAGSSSLVRLNKYLADCGIASRRKCDELISSGMVLVDGSPVTELGVKVDPSAQHVEVNGEVLKAETQRMRYYLLNKPKGVICTNEERESKPRAIDLITDRAKGRIYSVGRLDEDSSGLLMLTNDGAFAQAIAHPRHGVPKTYRVQVRGRVEPDALDRIRRGVHLAEGKTGRARVYVERNTAKVSTLSVTLHEGKNREVRRVFASVGYSVLGLQRTRIGTLTDRSLRIGHWRPMAAVEVQELLEFAHAGPQEDAEESEASAPRSSSGHANGRANNSAKSGKANSSSSAPDSPSGGAKSSPAKPRSAARGAGRVHGAYGNRENQVRKAKYAGGRRSGASAGASAGAPGRNPHEEFREGERDESSFVPHPLSGRSSHSAWPSAIRPGKSGAAGEAGSESERGNRGGRKPGDGPKKTVAQRRHGKAKQGKDRGAPTRVGKKRGS